MIVDHPQLLADRYEIGELLGTGGMGTVFAGHDLRLDRPVAVKVLREDFHRDAALRRRFEREARAAARVSHPHAVAIFDVGEDDDHDAFIVMERLSGRTLVHELAGGPLDEPRLREIAESVLGALAAAHAQGIVHRDVKPGNILLDDENAVKIGDFGIATTLDPSETTTGVPLGTPAYTAPERLRGFAASECSDIYSLGVVLYEAAAGERPFMGDGSVAIAEAVVAGAHRPLGDRRSDLSPELVDAVERALATDPADRFVSAQAMLSALASAPASPPTVPLQPPSAPTAILPTPERVVARRAPERAPRVAPRRDRLWRGLAAAALSVALVIAVVLLVDRGDDGSPPVSAPSTTSPVATAVSAPAGSGGEVPVPEPLARALDRLERATQP